MYSRPRQTRESETGPQTAWRVRAQAAAAAQQPIVRLRWPFTVRRSRQRLRHSGGWYIGRTLPPSSASLPYSLYSLCHAPRSSAHVTLSPAVPTLRPLISAAQLVAHCGIIRGFCRTQTVRGSVRRCRRQAQPKPAATPRAPRGINSSERCTPLCACGSLTVCACVQSVGARNDICTHTYRYIYTCKHTYHTLSLAMTADNTFPNSLKRSDKSPSDQ
jgi:hypothetical protein